MKSRFVSFAWGMFIMALAMAIGVHAQNANLNPGFFSVPAANTCTGTVPAAQTGMTGFCFDGAGNYRTAINGATTFTCITGPACPPAAAGVTSLAINGGTAQTGAVAINVVTSIQFSGGTPQTGAVVDPSVLQVNTIKPGATGNVTCTPAIPSTPITFSVPTSTTLSGTFPATTANDPCSGS
jgi:hypothetical protein